MRRFEGGRRGGSQLHRHLDDGGPPGVIQHGMLTMGQLGAIFTPWLGEGGVRTSFEVRMENQRGTVVADRGIVPLRPTAERGRSGWG